MKLILKLVFVLLLLFVGSTVLAVVAYKYFPVPATPLMVIRSMEHPEEPVFTDWKHRWMPLDSISPYMAVAVMASEDQRFVTHNGFDFEAIMQARREYEERGRRRGASTISQQTAKNVFLWPQPSWARKGFEAYFTLLIENIWDKERIMEVYLNSIETGPGLYGVEAVAREHFGCSARELSRSECALIAATLPNPIRFSSKLPSAYMLKRQRQIKRQMKYIDFLPREKDKGKSPSGKQEAQ